MLSAVNKHTYRPGPQCCTGCPVCLARLLGMNMT